MVADEVRLIQKEMNLTRKLFADAMSEMKERLDVISRSVVERFEANTASRNKDCTRQLKKQDERTLKLEEDVISLNTQLKESIRHATATD